MGKVQYYAFREESAEFACMDDGSGGYLYLSGDFRRAKLMDSLSSLKGWLIMFKDRGPFKFFKIAASSNGKIFTEEVDETRVIFNVSIDVPIHEHDRNCSGGFEATWEMVADHLRELYGVEFERKYTTFNRGK